MPARAVSAGARPGLGVLRLLIGLNLAVFVLWTVSPAWLSDAGPVGFMPAHFMVNRALLAEGHYWTLITSAFSHQGLLHLFVNLMVLYSFGTALLWRWSSRTFLTFYLAAAVAASLGHVAVGFLIDRDALALGASGALGGVIMAFAFEYPRHRIHLLGILPLPAYLATLLFVGLDVWGVLAQSAGGGLPIGHGAHLGGAAFGLVYSLVQRWRRPPDWSEAEIRAHVEALLDAVQRGGVESLSDQDRALLAAVLRRSSGAG